jgi:uncharacterized protein (DUF2164 family)
MSRFQKPNYIKILAQNLAKMFYNQGLAELCVKNARHSLAGYTKHIATPTPEDR